MRVPAYPDTGIAPTYHEVPHGLRLLFPLPAEIPVRVLLYLPDQSRLLLPPNRIISLNMDRIDAAAAATYVIAAADSTFFVLDNSSSDIIPVSLKIRTARPDALNSTGKGDQLEQHTK